METILKFYLAKNPRFPRTNLPMMRWVKSWKSKRRPKRILRKVFGLIRNPRKESRKSRRVEWGTHHTIQLLRCHQIPMPQGQLVIKWCNRNHSNMIARTSIERKVMHRKFQNRIPNAKKLTWLSPQWILSSNTWFQASTLPMLKMKFFWLQSLLEWLSWIRGVQHQLWGQRLFVDTLTIFEHVVTQHLFP